MAECARLHLEPGAEPESQSSDRLPIEIGHDRSGPPREEQPPEQPVPRWGRLRDLPLAERLAERQEGVRRAGGRGGRARREGDGLEGHAGAPVTRVAMIGSVQRQEIGPGGHADESRWRREEGFADSERFRGVDAQPARGKGEGRMLWPEPADARALPFVVGQRRADRHLQPDRAVRGEVVGDQQSASLDLPQPFLARFLGSCACDRFEIVTALQLLATCLVAERDEKSFGGEVKPSRPLPDRHDTRRFTSWRASNHPNRSILTSPRCRGAK